MQNASPKSPFSSLRRRSAGSSFSYSTRRFRRRPWLEAMEERTLLSSIVVTNTDDSGTGSLRQAILDANAQGGAETITFDPTAFATAQTITLTSGDLELSDTTGTETITGPAAGVTVNARGTSRVFQVDSGVTASISGLTISGGSNSSGNGGGLVNYGTATLNDCTVSGNSAYFGGGVWNAPATNLTLTDCTVSGNSSARMGGGVMNQGTANLTDSTLSGNSSFTQGGGVCSRGAVTTLTELYRERQYRRNGWRPVLQLFQ